MRANEHAPDLIVGGVLLPVDAGPIRLHEAVDDRAAGRQGCT